MPCESFSGDYMDPDVAYLLGMLFARGQRIEPRQPHTSRRLIIKLKIRRKLPKLPPNMTVDPPMDLDLENERAFNEMRRRINDLLDANVDITREKRGAELSAVFVKPTIGWRDITMLVSNGTDSSTFLLPEWFFKFESTIHREFLRGFADVAVTPSWADNEYNRLARIAFPVVHDNLTFAKQLVRLFKTLKIKAPMLSGSPEERGSNKEHRIRPYAHDYESVGFGFTHKTKLLNLLAAHNREVLSASASRTDTS